MGVHFDPTISLGSIFSIIGLIIAIFKFWTSQEAAKKAQAAAQRDLEWRITNLETWRKEHTIDADSRQHLVMQLGTIVGRLEWVEAARERQRNAPAGKQRLNDV